MTVEARQCCLRARPQSRWRSSSSALQWVWSFGHRARAPSNECLRHAMVITCLAAS